MSEQTASAEQKNVWYYRPPTQQVVGVEGPLTGVQLLQRAKEGKIGLNTLVRNPVATKNQWVPAEKIPSLVTAISEARNSAAGAAEPSKAPSRPRVPPAPAASAPVRMAEPAEVAVVEDVVEVEVPPLPTRSAPIEPVNPFAQLAVSSAAPQAAEPNPFSPPSFTGNNYAAAAHSSKDRYPNLHRYLFAIKSIAFIMMILAMIAGAGVIITAIILQLVQVSISVLVSGFFTGLLIAGLGYVYYVLCLAGTEMMQVIIDIEANTRTRGGM